ncbi:MAG TPA: DUF3866 family protein [Acidimicrobiales bacterium]|nr:DUF3866 family protein [Acidimicrobiales bacterium]
MPRYEIARITAVTSQREGLQRVDTTRGRAYVLTQLTGPVGAGDDVVLNTTAVELGLGTGGWHIVHWNLANAAGWSAPGGGHVMKLRYTSLQSDTGVAEERDDYASPLDLDGRPVVAIGLHSQLAAVAVAFADTTAGRPKRLVYVMTDGGALPVALSDLVADLRDRDLLAATVTAGHAFGGDHEAVNVTSALDVAVACAHADAIVVGTGPGVVGTGTTHGHSPLEVAQLIDATAASNGRPIVALRVSDADARDRHRGVSHHSLTALARATTRATVAIPADDAAGDLGDVGQHDVVPVPVPDVAALLDDAGLRVTTMGRGPADEPRFFRYAAAAGALAAALTRT